MCLTKTFTSVSHSLSVNCICLALIGHDKFDVGYLFKPGALVLYCLFVWGGVAMLNSFKINIFVRLK